MSSFVANSSQCDVDVRNRDDKTATLNRVLSDAQLPTALSIKILSFTPILPILQRHCINWRRTLRHM